MRSNGSTQFRRSSRPVPSMSKRTVRLTEPQASILRQALHWIDSAGTYSEFWESIYPHQRALWDRTVATVVEQTTRRACHGTRAAGSTRVGNPSGRARRRS